MYIISVLNHTIPFDSKYDQTIFKKLNDAKFIDFIFVQKSRFHVLKI